METAQASMPVDTANVQGTVFFDDVPVEGAEAKGTPHPVAPPQDFFSQGNFPGSEFMIAEKNTISPIRQDDKTVFLSKVVDAPVVAVEPDGFSMEIVEKMYKYFFNASKTRHVTETYYIKGGDVREVDKEIANTPPHFSEFGRMNKIPMSRMKLWKKIYPEFRTAWDDCTAIIKEFLIDNGLMGHYSAQMAIFTAKNETDMQDKHVEEKRVYDVSKILDHIENNKPYQATDVMITE